MGKLYYIMGRSGVGKDSVVALIKDKIKMEQRNVKDIIVHTTRPMRPGEQNGREYYFISEEEFIQLNKSGKFLETRVYHTVYGDWYYGTSYDAIDILKHDYLVIGTLEAYKAFYAKYKEAVIPILITANRDRLVERTEKRLIHCSEKDRLEIMRRMKADDIDFSEDKIKVINKIKIFSNDSTLENCANKIWKYMREEAV